MAKHRKTRQEKILADHRHILYHLETPSAQKNEPMEKKVKVDLPSVLPDYQTQTPRVQSTASYVYVIKDIRKTAFITFSIITAQLILFLILNRI